ncbi:MAG: WYL domain-containing protein [Firmicutes bacterium]|nr:WYL domain-containing protein [Bacillota bacterium]
MGNVIEGKLRTLLIMETLLQKSDQDNRISTKGLIEMLESKGIKAERKSIYADIDTLTEWGLDIIYSKEKPAGYFVAGRDFELPELKLLVDAVQSSKFITRKKSRELIEKLEKLTSESQARELRRNVYVSGRIKTDNEQIFYNVDKIHEAIGKGVQIEFTYYEWDLNKELVPKKNRSKYVISPWFLTWDDENYYLIGYDSKADGVKHYRVDKMKAICLTKKEREGEELFADFDPAGYARQTFGMFGGEPENVTLECSNSLIGVILDRFGTDNIVVPVDGERFRIQQQVNVSGQFFGWLLGLGAEVKIVHPKHLADRFTGLLDDVMERYKTGDE